MKIVKLDYSEFNGLPEEWEINKFTLGDINLIVGQNATGKTRLLNIITSLARLVSQKTPLKWSEADFSVEFYDIKESKTINYELVYSKRKITNESLIIDGEVVMRRSEDGIGIMKAEELGVDLKFQVSHDEVAAIVREDQIQHPYLSKLHQWGNDLIRYNFSSPMGKNKVFMLDESGDEGEKDILNIRDPNNVVGIYWYGINEFGENYKESIIEDMSMLGYILSDIGVRPPPNIEIIEGPKFVKGMFLALYIIEKGIAQDINQLTMSQGMFRALSTIIQLNYLIFSSKLGTLLIDDIGEGLDYERSSSLVQLIIEKARNENVQLIMATNDRFIMNKVPVEHWVIIHREGTVVKSFNIRNSKKIFDEFLMTGLSNFDLFSTEYYLKDR